MIKKVIIPVAGLGTRFLPATKAQPKEMLPIIDKPIIQYLVEEAKKSGMKDVIFITGRNKRAIEDHFDFSPELELALSFKNKNNTLEEVRAISSLARFTYIRQNKPLGDGDAILCGRHMVGEDENVAVMFGDDLVDSKTPVISQLVKVHQKFGTPVIALEKIDKKEVSKYGVVKAKKISDNVYKIIDIVEKPSVSEAPSDMVCAGKFIITPEIFEELEKLKKRTKSGEVIMANALKEYLKKKPIYGLLFEGKRYDCGSKLGFLKATVELGLKHKEVGVEFKKYLRQLNLG